MHHYRFTLFALSTPEGDLKQNPSIAPGHINADQFRIEFKDQIINEYYILGTFSVD
jgi:phosphatidylethanolamine-binding protein (PEBP) family uncharacterized protein